MMREVIARARARRYGMDPDVITVHGGRPMWMHYLNDVDADLAAIAAHGGKILGREPTAEMIDAAGPTSNPYATDEIRREEWTEIYQRMWDAAP